MSRNIPLKCYCLHLSCVRQVKVVRAPAEKLSDLLAVAGNL